MKTLMKTKKALQVGASTLILLLGAGCSSGNLTETKNNAVSAFKNNGFDVVGYHGYQWGFLGFNDYGGAVVWYTVKKPDSDITYEAALQRWGDEYHLYALSAIDAIKPN